MPMGNYDLVNGRSNFLLVASGALFLLLFIMIAYYIYQYSANPSAIMATSAPPNKAAAASGGVASASPVPSVSPASSSLAAAAAPVGYHLATTPTAPEVFNVSENIYGYQEAEAVCKAFGSKVATYDQIVEAASKGANWCNYGWSADQRILYPVQKSVWQSMLNNYGGAKGACGKTWPPEFAAVNFGVQGGYEPNPNMQYGVNCYGVKSAPLAHESVKQKMMSDKDIAIQNEVARLLANRNNMTILPFNQEVWSSRASA